MARITGKQLATHLQLTGSLSISGSLYGDGSNLTGIGVPAGTISSSAQVISSLPAGTISGSSQLPSGIISGSTQLSYGIISSSAQFDTLTLPFTGSFTGSFIGDGSSLTLLPAQTENDFTTALKNKLDAIEASADVTDAANVLANLPNGVISGSSQLPSGLVSGSTQLPLGLISGSAQVIAHLPAGTISGSIQVSHDDTTGFVANEHIDWTTDQGATNIHPGNYTDTNTTYSITDGELSENNFTTTLKNKLDAIEASADVTDATNVLANLPAGIISGSAQISITESQISDLGLYLTSVPAGTISGSSQMLTNLVGSDLVVKTITAEEYVVSSSVTHMTTSFSSGSTIFGDDILDTHQFTGSLYVSGSLYGDGSNLTGVGGAAGTISSSAQLPSGIISSSTQFDTLTLPFTGSFTGSFAGDGSGIISLPSQTENDFTTTLKNKLDAIEASADVTDAANVLANLPSGTISGSAQLPSGIISGSTQFDTLTFPFTGSFTGSFVGDGTGITGISGASDENFTTTLKNKLDAIEASADVTDAANVLANLPSGVISGSTQFDTITLPFTGSFTGSFAGDGSGITGISGASDENFTTALKNKLDGIEASADVTDAANVLANLPSGVISGSAQVDYTSISNVSSGLISGSSQFNTLTLPFTGSFTGSFKGDGSALISLPTQTENDFTTTLKNKLDAIEAAADVTDATNVAAAGALMDSEVTSLALIKGLTAASISGSFTSLSSSIASDVATNTAKVTNVSTNLTKTVSGTGFSINSSDGDNVALSLADTDNWGLMSDEMFDKLDGIEASADVTDATNVLASLPSGVVSSSAQIDHDSTTNFVANEHIDWTTDQGATNIHSGNYTDTNTTYSVGDGGLSEINFTSADNSKLDGIEALADVTDAANVLANLPANIISSSAQLPSGLISGSTQFDTLTLPFTGSFTGSFAGDGSGLTSLPAQTANDFTTTLKNKLDAIEASADVTDATNVLANLPSGIISGSTQLPANIISSSAQLPSGIISGSIQFNTLTLPFTGSFTGSFVGDGSLLTSLPAQTANDFTTTLKNKLDGIEALADVTDATNVAAAGALMDSEVSALALIKGLTAASISGSFTSLSSSIASDVATNTAKVTNVSTNLSKTVSGTGFSINSSDGDNVALSLADTDNWGLMSDEMFDKLDGIEALADVTDTTNVLANLPAGIISGSAQLPSGLISGSIQFNTLTLPFTGSFTGSFVGDGSGITGISGASDENFTTTLKNKLDGIEALADVTDAANVLANLPAGIISGSAQLPSDIISGSSQFDTLTLPFTGSFTGSFAGDGSGLTSLPSQTENDFTTTLKNKLDAIEASADVTDATNVLANLPAGIISGSTQVDHDSTTNFVANEHIDWTTDQGATNIHSGNYTDTNTTYSVTDGELSENNFTTTLKNKLDAIEASADVTDAANVLANLPANIISSSAQFDTITLPFTGSFTGSFQGTAELIQGDVKISGGSLGVGVTANETDGRIDASNDIVAYSSSDKRWKTNIKIIESPLEKLQKLSGVEFDWIEDSKLHGNSGNDVGVIAQEVELVLPQAVQTRDTGMKAVRYEKIIPLLIETIKEQQKQIDDLKNKIG
jgi:hypothetical protein